MSDADIQDTWQTSFERRTAGKLGGMTPEEIEAFLQKPILMRLACLKPNGDPHVTVTWHEWRDGYFWLVVRQRSMWAKYLKNDPRVSFVIDHEHNLEKVSGEGRAEVVEEPNLGGDWVEITRRCALRYGMPLPYLESTRHQPRWVFRIKPTKFTTWQGMGWSRRFWVDGTGGPTYDEAHSMT